MKNPPQGGQGMTAVGSHGSGLAHRPGVWFKALTMVSQEPQSGFSGFSVVQVEGSCGHHPDSRRELRMVSTEPERQVLVELFSIDHPFAAVGPKLSLSTSTMSKVSRGRLGGASRESLEAA